MIRVVGSSQLHTAAPPVPKLKNLVEPQHEERENEITIDDMWEDDDYLPRSNQPVISTIQFTSGEPVQTTKFHTGDVEVSMAYQDVGASYGHPILVIHDMPGYSEDFKDLFKPFVKAGYRVIAPNLPGFGISQSSQPLRGVPQIIQLLRDFLSEIKVSQLHSVVGHGTGALIACQLAATSDDCHSLVAINPTGFNNMSSAQWYGFLKESPFTAPLLAMSDPDGIDGNFQPEHIAPLLAAIETEASLQLNDLRQAATAVMQRKLPVVTFLTRTDMLTSEEDGVDFAQTCGVAKENVFCVDGGDGKDMKFPLELEMQTAFVFNKGGHDVLKEYPDVVSGQMLKVLNSVDAGIEREQYAYDNVIYENAD
jgi:pimeloyl-ACP methyl ester carboxylesterase